MNPTAKSAKASGRFLLVAGDPALELVNTVTNWHDKKRAEDLISTQHDLTDWVRSVGLDAVTAPVTQDDLVTIGTLRSEIHNVFAHVAAGGSVGTTGVAGLLRKAAERFESADKPSLTAELAWRAISALISLPDDRIRSCPSCGWLFYDNSRGGRRRWCIMAVCGTSAKVGAFRQRKSKANE